MKEVEYVAIRERMKAVNGIKNNLLTFSFTTVLAVIGLAFTQEYSNQPLIYLLPFFLIIPFTGRITYYQLWFIRMRAYLQVFAYDIEGYEMQATDVEVLYGKTGKVIDFLTHFEMLFLSFVCALLFYIKYPDHICNFTPFDWIMVVIPIGLLIFVFFIIKSTSNYKKVKDKYVEDWEKRKDFLEFSTCPKEL